MNEENREIPGPSGTSNTTRQEEINEFPYKKNDGDKEELIPQSNIWICKTLAEILRKYALSTPGQNVPQFLIEMLLKSLLGRAYFDHIVANYSTICNELNFGLPNEVISAIEEFVQRRYAEENIPSPFGSITFERYLDCVFSQSNELNSVSVDENEFHPRLNQRVPLSVNVDLFFEDNQFSLIANRRRSSSPRVDANGRRLSTYVRQVRTPESHLMRIGLNPNIDPIIQASHRWHYSESNLAIRQRNLFGPYTHRAAIRNSNSAPGSLVTGSSLLPNFSIESSSSSNSSESSSLLKETLSPGIGGSPPNSSNSSFPPVVAPTSICSSSTDNRHTSTIARSGNELSVNIQQSGRSSTNSSISSGSTVIRGSSPKIASDTSSTTDGLTRDSSTEPSVFLKTGEVADEAVALPRDEPRTNKLASVSSSSDINISDGSTIMTDLSATNSANTFSNISSIPRDSSTETSVFLKTGEVPAEAVALPSDEQRKRKLASVSSSSDTNTSANVSSLRRDSSIDIPGFQSNEPRTDNRTFARSSSNFSMSSFSSVSTRSVFSRSSSGESSIRRNSNSESISLPSTHNPISGSASSNYSIYSNSTIMTDLSPTVSSNTSTRIGSDNRVSSTDFSESQSTTEASNVDRVIRSTIIEPSLKDLTIGSPSYNSKTSSNSKVQTKSTFTGSSIGDSSCRRESSVDDFSSESIPLPSSSTSASGSSSFDPSVSSTHSNPTPATLSGPSTGESGIDQDSSIVNPSSEDISMSEDNPTSGYSSSFNDSLFNVSPDESLKK